MKTQEIDSLFELLETSLRKRSSGSLVARAAPFYIYGAGNVGKGIATFLRERSVKVDAFLDRKAQARSSWEEIPILLPDDESIAGPQRERGHVIIGIFNREVEIPPIVKLLKAEGYGRVTTFLEFHDQFAAELGDRFWLTSREFYLGQRESIEAACEIWTDEESRDLYQEVLKFRFAMDYDALPKPSPEAQYFPFDLPSWSHPLRFIDCGAFDGDTLRYLLETTSETPVDAIAAFEPDLLNFSKLAASVQPRATSVAETLCLFPCGVGSGTTQLRFSSGEGEASCTSENGNSIIQCVSLDEALPAFRPNLIKMDIEGAEPLAMLGARRTIEAHRPGLAICVYHRPDHLWTIPLVIKSWLQGGRHYLRAYNYNAFDLVYYWIP